MKIEARNPELIEAHVLGFIGLVKGIHEQFVAPVVEDQPIWAYMLCGAIGGIVVNRLLGDRLAA